MLQRIMMNTVCGRLILSIAVAGVLLRMITMLSYKSMRYAAENAGKTKRQWIQVLKKRFENYERFGRIGNVEAFVEHYFSRKGILGIPLGFWDKSILFLSIGALLTGFIGAFQAYQTGTGMEQIVIFLFSGGAACAALSMLHIMTDTKEAKRRVLVALVDYLSNGMPYRKNEDKNTKVQQVPTKEEVEAMSEAAVTEEEKQLLADVLEDYFW